MAQAEEPACRLSLRMTLLVICVLGAGVGLLGRLYATHPDITRGIVAFLSTVLPFLLAIGTIVRIGQLRRNKAIIAWGIMLCTMPLIGITTMWVLQQNSGNSRNWAMMSNTELIETHLVKEMESPWVWNELAKRGDNGSLSAEQADAALLQMARHMKTKRPDGWDQPLHWQRQFMEAITEKQLASDETLVEFYDAFYGKPRLNPFSRIREGSALLPLDLRYGSVWGDHSSLKHVLVWRVAEARLDKEPVPMPNAHRSGEHWNGQIQRDWTAGEHQVTVKVEAAYIKRDDLVGLDPEKLKRWPNPLKQWTHTVTRDLTIYPEGASLVELVTDPKLHPQKTGAIGVERLVAQLDVNNLRKVILQFELGGTRDVGLSFDVQVVVDEDPIPMGNMQFLESENGTFSRGIKLEAAILDLDPQIQFADVILTPNPDPVETDPDFKKIWGKPIRITGVPLERLDVETSGNVVPDSGADP